MMSVAMFLFFAIVVFLFAFDHDCGFAPVRVRDPRTRDMQAADDGGVMTGADVF